MHKKLEDELVSLAHSIIQSKNAQNITVLTEKARLIYEKLIVLSFVDKSFETKIDNLEKPIVNTPQKTELNQVVKPATIQKTKIEEKTKPIIPIEEKDLFKPEFNDVKIDIGSLKPNQISLKEELRDTVSADKTSTLFDDTKPEKKTINDRAFSDTIQIGLNDRIGFVKHLFNYSQEDFNRVLSQLNTFKTEKEAKDFILDSIKPDYNWEGKEEYEERLLELIERKFN